MDPRQDSQGVIHQPALLACALPRPAYRTVAVPQTDGCDDFSPRADGLAFGRTRRVEGRGDGGAGEFWLSTSSITTSSRRGDRILREAQLLWGQWIGVN
jgi:hypothetical protein